MSFPSVSRPLSRAAESERVGYLKRVLLWTVGGLTLSGVTGVLSAGGLALAASSGMTFLFNKWVSMGLILGAFAVAQMVAPKLVFGEQKLLGFGLGAVAQGFAMGFLLLAAAAMGAATGSPFGLIGMAMAMTVLTGVGLTSYVWTGPKEFSMLGAALSALSIPMLVLMGVGLVFPALFGGTFGLIISLVFVGVSVGGLLYQINQVMHRLNTDQHIEGAYTIMMGILVLFWNILSLLMRMNRR